MKISGRRDYLVGLESIAMTDIVMNMFIFFFISFSLLYTFGPNNLQKLSISVPKVKNSSPLENEKRLKIYIRKDGVVYLEKNPLTMEELEQEMKTFLKSNEKISTLLYADKSTQFEKITRVFDLLSGLGITIHVAVIPEK